MTLEEEINRFERLASNYEFNLEMHQHNVMKLSVNDIEIMKKYAQENRQRAEWLRELKAYRKAKKKIIENMKAWEKIYNEPLEWNVEDINSIKLAFYQDGKADAYTDCIGICEIAFEEVNADDNIQS